MSFINDRNNNIFLPCYHTDSIDSNRNFCAGLTISKNSHNRHFPPCLFDLAKNDSAKIRESCCATDNFSGKLLPTSYVNPVNESLSISAFIAIQRGIAYRRFWRSAIFPASPAWQIASTKNRGPWACVLPWRRTLYHGSRQNGEVSHRPDCHKSQ